MRFLLATTNAGKAREIDAILRTAGLDVSCEPRPTDVAPVDETGDSLEANARLKARAVRDATGEATIADDTGLEVDALGGAPGVYSARYAGEHASYADNVAKLLAAMAGHSDRSARFRTVAIAMWPDGREIHAEGAVEGSITTTASGGGGFGYDPVFTPDGSSVTFAEMAPDDKHALSHRGRAFRALAGLLPPDA